MPEPRKLAKLIVPLRCCEAFVHCRRIASKRIGDANSCTVAEFFNDIDSNQTSGGFFQKQSRQSTDCENTNVIPSSCRGIMRQGC